MSGRTVGILHPGDMGAAVGACARARGARTLWVAAGRSGATRERAQKAGLEAVDSLAALARAADTIVSVCPPHAALDVARAIAALGFGGLYLDANAIAPETSREVGRIVTAAGARYVDGGIIGPPPATRGRTRLYLAGEDAARVAALFTDTALETPILDGPVGAASAVKACYAAWTKGTTALVAGIHALAEHEGVGAAIVAEWAQSQPSLAAQTEKVRNDTRKAWRWVGEMEEIAAAFAAAGLPEGFHRAAARIYERLEDFKDTRSPPAIEAVTAALSKGKR